jgi:transposase
MQDNDPKHTSRCAQSFFSDNAIHWWKTPPESPDLNPIENMWHELKEFIRREVKPHTKQELIDGIVKFWDTDHC